MSPEDALEPLEPLFEAPGADAGDLGGPLRRLYGGELGFAETAVYANFVASLDGSVALPAIPRSNALIAGGSPADRFVMGLLRAFADVVVIGSGTLRASPKGTWLPGGPHPASTPHLAELRRRRGLPEHPELALLTGSGEIDATHPALARRTAILTSAAGAARLEGRVPESVEVLPLTDRFEIEPELVVEALRGRGHRLMLFEAGPHTLGRFVAAGLVDELFLTVSPLLTGGTALTRLSLVEGVDAGPEPLGRAELRSVRRHGDHLFLRYRLRRS